MSEFRAWRQQEEVETPVATGRAEHERAFYGGLYAILKVPERIDSLERFISVSLANVDRAFKEIATSERTPYASLGLARSPDDESNLSMAILHLGSAVSLLGEMVELAKDTQDPRLAIVAREAFLKAARARLTDQAAASTS